MIIDFRVWCEQEKKWVYVHISNAKGFPVYSQSGSAFPKKLLEFEQYTGIKDKNGKKIYERDLITKPFTPRSNPCDNWDGEKVVYFPNDYEMLLIWYKEVEVVGNIHKIDYEPA